ncbi:hypothetical protein J1N35_034524 [Gossypium stocksii]|uniref:Uncharacterized protein n=1 Tax=Gossypium stocksii TaxID=47602 RepID=A0A9D3UT12_9ROSI|nr:hypothetical protein J1N35_034524 [Gossypium stocksii]
MPKLMRFFVKAEENRTELDVNTQIEMVFKSLTKGLSCFRSIYNLGNNAFTLTQFMKELQSYELILNGRKPIQEKLEANLAVGSSSSMGK